MTDRELEILHKVANDVNRLKRQLVSNIDFAACNHRHSLAGDKLHEGICRWLSAPDPWKNYHIAHGLRQSGTGAWFIEGDTLPTWKVSRPSSLLWVHGKRELPSSAYSFADADGITLS